MIVDRCQAAFSQRGAEVAIVGGHLKLAGFVQVSLHAWNIVLGNGENERNGLQLRDDHDPIGVIGFDDVAHIDDAQADAPGDGGGDARVIHLQLRVLQIGLIHFDNRFGLLEQSQLFVVFLLRVGIAGSQLLGALQIDFGQFQLSLIALQLTFRLIA